MNTAVSIPDIQYFKAENIQKAWDWIQEFPSLNFDDYAPKTPEAFMLDLLQATKRGQLIFEILSEGKPVGMIRFQPTIPGHGEFCGMCLAKEHQRQGIMLQALSTLVARLRKEGFHKLQGKCFPDNFRMQKLFDRLGFKEEGHFKNHTTRGGKDIDVLYYGWVAPREMDREDIRFGD